MHLPGGMEMIVLLVIVLVLVVLWRRDDKSTLIQAEWDDSIV